MPNLSIFSRKFEVLIYFSCLIISVELISCPDNTFSNTKGDKCFFVPNDTKAFTSAEINCINSHGVGLASVSSAFDNMKLTGKDVFRPVWINIRS